MFHKQRTWTVFPAASTEDLARQLTESRQSLDAGFQLQGYLFLNDSITTDPGRHQEYAVVKRPQSEGEPFVQVESLTITRMNREGLQRIVERAISGHYDEAEFAHAIEEPKLVENLKTEVVKSPEGPEMEPPLDMYHAVMVAEGATEPKSEEEYVAAWQTLVDTGLAWRLQGWFGRTARDLIDAGVIQRPQHSWHEEVSEARDMNRGAVMSFAIQVQEKGTTKWVGNGLRFPDKEQAQEYGRDLSSRWSGIQSYRVIESSEPANSTFVNRQLDAEKKSLREVPGPGVEPPKHQRRR